MAIVRRRWPTACLLLSFRNREQWHRGTFLHISDLTHFSRVDTYRREL
jgi:hypothetical protein